MRKSILAVLLLAALPAAWGKKHGHDDDRDDRDGVRVSVNYSNYRIPREEAVVVSDYYRGRPLPPGLAKKLRRGGSLPPGWQKKIQPVPVAVEERLAPVPAGCRRGIIDGAFVVYEPNRGVIIDVMASFGR